LEKKMPESHEKAKEMEPLIFENARKLYPGVKRGFETEFSNLRKKHKDWKEVLSLLKPAIEEQIARRDRKIAENKFAPSWKHFKTWINNRSWEDTEEGVTKRKSNHEAIRKQKIRDVYQDFFEYLSADELMQKKKDPHIDYTAGWLIDEILEKRNG
jgi:hypothetical protein